MLTIMSILSVKFQHSTLPCLTSTAVTHTAATTQQSQWCLSLTAAAPGNKLIQMSTTADPSTTQQSQHPFVSLAPGTTLHKDGPDLA